MALLLLFCGSFWVRQIYSSNFASLNARLHLLSAHSSNLDDPNDSVKPYVKIVELLSDLVENAQLRLDFNFVNITMLRQSIAEGMSDNISMEEFYHLAAETAAYMSTDHPDYGRLAATITVSYLHQTTNPSFSQTVDAMYHHYDAHTQAPTTNLSPHFYEKVKKYGKLIDSQIQPGRDFDFDYFGVKTLEK